MRVVLDGRCCEDHEAKIGITDRGFLCGDGVFTTLQVRDGKSLCLEAHLSRLENHCVALHIAPPPIERQWIEDLIKANGAEQGIWRLRIYITGGEGQFVDMTPRSCGHVLMMLIPYESHMDSPCHLKTYPHPIVKPFAFVKSLAYLDRYWIKEFARQEGCDEALVLSPEGYICEAGYANIFWCHDNQFYSPDPLLPIVHGIALNFAIEAAKEMGMAIHRVRAKLSDIPSDANLYLSNSMVEFIPIVQIDERTFPLNPTFEETLRSHYNNLVASL